MSDFETRFGYCYEQTANNPVVLNNPEHTRALAVRRVLEVVSEIDFRPMNLPSGREISLGCKFGPKGNFGFPTVSVISDDVSESVSIACASFSDGRCERTGRACGQLNFKDTLVMPIN